jgi:hypothetical protein
MYLSFPFDIIAIPTECRLKNRNTRRYKALKNGGAVQGQQQNSMK